MSSTITRTLPVNGMTCGHCIQAVTSELTQIKGVHDVAVLITLSRAGAGTHAAQLGVEGHLHIGGQEIGDQGGQADAQVHNVAVLQLFCHTGSDGIFDLSLIHYRFPPSTM